MNQLNIFDYLNDEIRIDNPIRLIELFGGYGSQALALEKIGADFETYKLVEFDKYAVKSYNAIHGTEFEPQDITKIHAVDLEIKETEKFTYLLTYSFPCQDLSVAGNQNGMSKGSGTRSGLLWEVERLLQEIVNNDGELPQVLFMENVKQVISKKNMPDFEQWLHFLESIGYTNTYKVLNAKDYGVPQNRERCFMFSFLGNRTYKFPEPIELKLKVKDILENEVEEKYYIKNEKSKKLINDLLNKGYLKQKSNVVDGTINNPKEKDISNCITARYDCGISNQRSVGTMVAEQKVRQVGNIVETGNWNNPQRGRIYSDDGLSPALNCCGGGGLEPKFICASRGRNKGVELEQRLEVNARGTSNALTTVQKDNYVLEPINAMPIEVKLSEIGKPLEIAHGLLSRDYKGFAKMQYGNAVLEGWIIRKLTPKECGRLMGVPDKYIDKMMEVNSNTQCYKQFGNSIVVDVMVAMFRNLNIQGIERWNK